MATKKELEQRIAMLEAEVASLRAAHYTPVVITPPALPYYPSTWPHITCASDSTARAVKVT